MSCWLDQIAHLSTGEPLRYLVSVAMQERFPHLASRMARVILVE